jgi:hypothetical protein
MAEIDDLLVAIQSSLGTVITPSITSQSDIWDVFEAYVWALVIDAAVAEGATVSYETVTGVPNPPTFTFRTSPGFLASATNPYTHAIVQFPGKVPLEVHVGIKVQGKSRVLHECDVCVLLRQEASLCRQYSSPGNWIHPRASSIILSVECKFYANYLPLHLARGFMGLCTELSSDACHFVLNIDANSAKELFAHHHKHALTDVRPANQSRVIALRHMFQDRFRYFVHARKFNT